MQTISCLSAGTTIPGKDVFNDVLNLFQTNNVNNYDIVFNDLNLKKSRYGRYDNYYKQ